MKKEEYLLPANLFLFGFADDVAHEQQLNYELAGRCKKAIADTLEPVEGFNRNITSFALKQFIEKQIGEEVSNGEFIAAMLASGYEYERLKCTPHCYFNAVKKGRQETGSQGQ